MKAIPQHSSGSHAASILSNAEIADQLASLGQLLSFDKANAYKVKAYQRAATKIRTLSESVSELVRDESDLTQYAGIGDAIASGIREIVMTGSLRKLEALRSEVTPELASISSHPRLDPKRVLRIYKKLNIASIAALGERLANGEIEKKFGVRMAQHVREGLAESHAMLLYRADPLRDNIEEFLIEKCGARRAEVAGGVRRRVEVIEEMIFIVETDDFPKLVRQFEGFGGRTPCIRETKNEAVFALSSGISLRIRHASEGNWGFCFFSGTGSEAHVGKLAAVAGGMGSLKAAGPFATENDLYQSFGLSYIEPELREGYDEIQRAAQGMLPLLVTTKNIRGELHAHSASSDGSYSIEQMAMAAKARGYEYIGITDHSQSLKIANGVSVDDLWKQIGFIDKLNGRIDGIRILKSAEVDILADGSLDYPDDLLCELDYTVCSIHSRFALGRTEQTQRILRAMDTRYFNILGHATGRLLLKRPGYEIDIDRVIAQAKKNGCFLEINSSPDRLDLSAENARAARNAGVKVAISTDAHSTREFGNVQYGVDQARRGSLEKTDVLNCLPLKQLGHLFKR